MIYEDREILQGVFEVQAWFIRISKMAMETKILYSLHPEKISLIFRDPIRGNEDTRSRAWLVQFTSHPTLEICRARISFIHCSSSPQVRIYRPSDVIGGTNVGLR